MNRDFKTLKKGDHFKLSVRGHNNFCYPGESIFKAENNIKYSYMSWTNCAGLRPVKVLTDDLSIDISESIKEKFTVIWISL